MNKITFEYINVELTRNCNMRCRHCLRGEPQNVNIDHSYIDALLDQTQLVGGLTLTGGEPMLCLDTIEYIVDGLCKRGIPLLNFSMYTNGLIYNEQFIKIIKRYKSLIDVSCSNCFADGDNYKSEEEVSRCIVGISLDRYHENHDICEEHYKKYKEALCGYADVLKVMHGNQPAYSGRAKCLNVRTIDSSHVYKICPLQRIEILSKEHTPVCKAYNTYHMFDPEQKIVCCDLYLDVNGMLSSEYGGAVEYSRNDTFPKICNTNEPIWKSILEYNKNRFPCAKWQAEMMKVVKDNFSLTDLINGFTPQDAQDEPSTQVLRKEKTKNVGIKELAKQIAIINKDWREIATEAACHSYYDGDERGNSKPQISTIQINPAKQDPLGLRCWWCCKVIQTDNGRNIHSEQTEHGLKCQYCGSVNTAENAVIMHK